VKNKFILLIMFLFSFHPAYSEEIPSEIITFLGRNLQNPDGRLHSTRTAQANLYVFVKSHRDSIVPAIIARDPQDIVAENLALATSQCSEPRDYLIIVTQFLNEVADGNFAVEKDKWIISSLIKPVGDKTEGLIAMNYQLPELNNALRRASSRLKSSDQEWISSVLSGKQKKQTIDFFEGQGFPLPPTFSSLYPKGQADNSSSRTLKNLSETSSHESILESTSKDSKWGRFKSEPLWWICTVGGLLLVGVVIRLASRLYSFKSPRKNSPDD
jgi:hypothetical protein